jgi:very-short-patch-repair endonuclease
MGYNKTYDCYRPTDKYWTDKMLEYKKENSERSKTNKAENRMFDKLTPLREFGIRFNRQCIRGTRIFDFRCKERGIAIEVDGGYHQEEWKKSKDLKYDTYNKEYSGIILIRIPNFDEEAANEAIKTILCTNAWQERRYFL